MRTFLFLSLFLCASASAKPLALVYRGKGACYGCEKGAAKAALAAGLSVVYVDETLTDWSILDRAAVWIQPGGKSGVAIQAMGATYLSQLRSFIAGGGGYVGFCAGGFLSTELNGTTGLHGLGVVPGRSIPIYKDGTKEDHPYILKVTWEGERRSLYFNGGPFFDLSGVTDPELRILATYDDFEQRIAALATRYESGRVAVSGPHPEELSTIKLLRFKSDPDGSDVDLAVQMIHWAANI